MNLRTPPRRERRVLFAELSNQGGRSAPTQLFFPTIIDAYRINRARQTSIISATAPPAPALVTNVVVDPVAFTIPIAFTHDHFVTCTASSCQFTDTAKTIPLCSCHPQHSRSTDHGNSFKACSLGRTSPRSLEFSCQDRPDSLSHTRESFAPATASREAPFLAIRKSEPHLPSSRAIATFCISCSSTSWTPKNCSPLSLTHSNSMLSLSAASGASAVAGITCSVVSLTRLAASLTDTLHVPEFSSISRSRLQRQSDVSHRLTLGASIAWFFSRPAPANSSLHDTDSPLRAPSIQTNNRAWRPKILAELFRVNLQTGLVHRGWDCFLSM